jgi:hypothetical protein
VSWVQTKSQKSWSGSAGSAVAAQPRIASYTSGSENASSVAIRRYGQGKLRISFRSPPGAGSFT